jgi:thiol-disulfide isomerase/thioredoxin
MSEQQSPAVLPAVFLVHLVLAAAAGVYFFMESTEPAAEGRFKQMRIGRLPGGWMLMDLDGKQVQAGDFLGKVVFLNHWATWCGPCVAEMPSINALHESLRGSDVAFIIVTREQPGVVKSFVKAKNWSLPIYIALEPLPPVLRTDGIPATFVINRKGEVVFRAVGGEDWNDDEFRAFLKKLS